MRKIKKEKVYKDLQEKNSFGGEMGFDELTNKEQNFLNNQC